jgi:hypothetical protein
MISIAILDDEDKSFHVYFPLYLNLCFVSIKLISLVSYIIMSKRIKYLFFIHTLKVWIQIVLEMTNLIILLYLIILQGLYI